MSPKYANGQCIHAYTCYPSYNSPPPPPKKKKHSTHDMKLHLIYVLKTHHVGSTIQEMQLQAKFLLWRDFPNDVQAPSSFGRFRFKVSVCCPIFLSFYLSVYSVHPSPIQHWKVKIRGLIKDPWSKRNGLSRIIMSYFSEVLSFILCSFLSPQTIAQRRSRRFRARGFLSWSDGGKSETP